MPATPPKNFDRKHALPDHRTQAVEDRFDVRDSASCRLGREAPNQVDGHGPTNRAEYERERKRPERMGMDVGYESVADAVGFGQRAAKRNGNQARKQANQQRSRKLTPPLLVSAQEVAHFAPDHARGDSVAVGFLRGIVSGHDQIIRTNNHFCQGGCCWPQGPQIANP